MSEGYGVMGDEGGGGDVTKTPIKPVTSLNVYFYKNWINQKKTLCIIKLIDIRIDPKYVHPDNLF